MSNTETKLFAVLGNPIAHSLSPLLHSFFMEQCHYNGVYLAFAPKKEELAQAIAGLKALGAKGINVTIPYKEAVIPYLADLTPQAKICQAVNTLILTEKGFIGDNTDGNGLIKALEKQHGWQPEGRKILLIGAGGAAKGVAAAIARRQVAEIVIVNRTKEKAESLAKLLAQHSECLIKVLDWDALQQETLYQNVDTFINTTPVGMSPHIEAMAPVRMECLCEDHMAVDLIYNPLETKFLRLAKAQGAKTASGLGMFVEQGALSFAAWTTITPETTDAYRLIAETLNNG